MCFCEAQKNVITAAIAFEMILNVKHASVHHVISVEESHGLATTLNWYLQNHCCL